MHNQESVNHRLYLYCCSQRSIGPADILHRRINEGAWEFLSGSSIRSTVSVLKRPIQSLYRVDCIVEGLGYPLIAAGQYGAILVS